MKISRLLIVLTLVLSTTNAFAGYDKLTKKNYDQFKDKKAVVLYAVNWGRQWGCAGLDNAQLENLTFTRIDQESGKLSEDMIVLDTPSKLFVNNESLNYAIIVNPGEYVLSGFDVKVAKSKNDIHHLKASPKELLENGRAVDGTFEVNAGEMVYIGHFSLDCAQEPIPWRYYIEKDDFERYIGEFRKEYKFVDEKPVLYHLLQTKKFGQ